jgi:hypothetical protein
MSETLSLAFAFAWLMAAPAVQSQGVPPDVLMKSPSGEVIAEIRKDKATQGRQCSKERRAGRREDTEVAVKNWQI